MKTVINAVNELKGLGLSAVVGDKYLSSDGVTEKTINTYVHLFACDKEQLNDWSRAYTEFVWRINTGESPNFTGDVEWIDKNGEVHKVSMKTLYWDLDIVFWRPVLKSDKELDMDIWKNAPEAATHYAPETEYDVDCWVWVDGNEHKFVCVGDDTLDDKRVWYNDGPFNGVLIPRPVQSSIFTQEMADDGVLPSVGMECRLGELLVVYILGKTKNFELTGQLAFEVIGGDDERINEVGTSLGNFKPLTPPKTDDEKFMDALVEYNLCTDDLDWKEHLLGFIKSGELHGVSFQPLTVEKE